VVPSLKAGGVWLKVLASPNRRSLCPVPQTFRPLAFQKVSSEALFGPMRSHRATLETGKAGIAGGMKAGAQ
jgi:hypothetical protein